MPPHAFALFSVSLMVGGTAPEPTDKPGGDRQALEKAARKTTASRSYAFEVESKGAGAGGTVRGKYEQGKPVAFTADKIELLQKGKVLAYQDGGQWRRSKTGIQSDPLRVLGAVAKVRGTRLPHEELGELIKGLKKVEKLAKAEDPSSTEAWFRGDLDEAAAKKLAPPALRSVAREGRAKIRVGADGRVVLYEYTIRVSGRLGNAEIDGNAGKSVALSGAGKTRVEVPEAAARALE
jgi:hypothetical protein